MASFDVVGSQIVGVGHFERPFFVCVKPSECTTPTADWATWHQKGAKNPSADRPLEKRTEKNKEEIENGKKLK